MQSITTEVTTLTTAPPGLARVNDRHLVDHPDQPAAGLCACRPLQRQRSQPHQPRQRPAAAPAAPAAPAAAPAAAAAPTRPTPKGAVTIVVGEEPLMLAGHDATASFNNQIMRNFDEALLNRDPKTSELVPELATKWEQTNPTTWRFTLRQGVKFHDGSPFNAESAAEALNFMWSKENNFRVRGLHRPGASRSSRSASTWSTS